MMNIKKRIGLGAIGLVTLGGSVFGLSLASSTAGATALSSPAAESTTPDLGANVQDGAQSGDSITTDVAGANAVDSVTTDAGAASEAGAASDGPGGHQDPAGNVDNQSTTEQ